MNKLPVLMSAALLLAACGQKPSVETAIARLPADYAKKRIPGIGQMSFEELTGWVRTCAPYNATPEGRERNPYDPMDCDEVQYRHDSWRIKQTQKPAAYLPGLH